MENRFPIEERFLRGEPMILFSIIDLMDEQKSYEFLVVILHPDGLH